MQTVLQCNICVNYRQGGDHKMWYFLLNENPAAEKLLIIICRVGKVQHL